MDRYLPRRIAEDWFEADCAYCDEVILMQVGNRVEICVDDKGMLGGVLHDGCKRKFENRSEAR